MQEIGGFGLQVTLFASQTFPGGLTLTSFADDIDPFDAPDHTLADSAMGLNGDLITWEKANPLEVSLGIIPNSDDDINLQVLAEANRIGKGKQTAGDIIFMTIIYPDGTAVTYDSGKLMTAPLANGVASSARMKSKKYTFKFENKNQ